MDATIRALIRRWLETNDPHDAADVLRAAIRRVETIPDDACPGCLARPGDGLTVGCNDDEGCGHWRRNH